MAKVTEEEIDAILLSFGSRLTTRALQKIRQGASEQEVLLDLTGFTPPRELVREGIDIANIVQIAIGKARSVLPADSPRTLLLPQLDLDISAPAPPNEALARIANLREQISELEMAAFDLRKQTLLNKTARLEDQVRTGAKSALVFTLPPSAGEGRVPEFIKNREDIAPSAERDEETRIAIAMANLKASRPDLSIEEARRQATAAVRGSTALPDGSVLVTSRTAEAAAPPPGVVPSAPSAINTNQAISAAPPAGPVPSTSSTININQAISAAQSQGQSGLVQISPTQAIYVPTVGSPADIARTQPNYVAPVYDLV